jgi:hypothetical protein
MTVQAPRTNLTGFGDVLFGVLRDEGGTLPDFVSEPMISTRHVPGSNRTITHILGVGVSRATFIVWLETVDAYRGLRALLSTEATLTLIAGTTTEAGVYEEIHGTGYVRLADTLLVGMGAPVLYPDGAVEVEVTFQRAVP